LYGPNRDDPQFYIDNGNTIEELGKKNKTKRIKSCGTMESKKSI
jgi:hypothetical protein